MGDWPKEYNAGLGLDVSTVDLGCPVGEFHGILATASVVSAWPAALRALYVQVLLEDWLPVQSIGFHIGTASGNLDAGIYDERWNRIVGKGSTAAVAGPMWLDLTTAVNGTASPILSPGLYYLAMVVDNATCTVRGLTGTLPTIQVLGVQQQLLGALPLPATATPANPAATFIPYLTLGRSTLL